MGTKYREEITKSMEMLANNDKVIFLGQTVGYSGSRYTYGTLCTIPEEKRMELPIMEEVQMGISLGMALEGYIPISVYPRFDFLLLAINQLVNHLDKIEELTLGNFKPKVIIRTIVGGRNPYPGPQHCQDHTEALKKLLTKVHVEKLDRSEEIFPAYKRALEREGSTLLIEWGDLHFKEE